LVILYHITVSGANSDSCYRTQTVAPRINFQAHQQRSTFHEFQTFLRPNHETTPFAVLHSILSCKSFSKHLLLPPIYYTQNISTTTQPWNT